MGWLNLDPFLYNKLSLLVGDVILFSFWPWIGGISSFVCHLCFLTSQHLLQREGQTRKKGSNRVHFLASQTFIIKRRANKNKGSNRGHFLTSQHLSQREGQTRNEGSNRVQGPKQEFGHFTLWFGGLVPSALRIGFAKAYIGDGIIMPSANLGLTSGGLLSRCFLDT